MKASWITNVILKVLALLLAIFLWNFYRAEEAAIRFVTIPVQYQNLPADRELSGDVPGSVTLQLEAPEAMARGLTPDWIDARIDLSDVGIGEQSVRVAPEQVRVPAGARVLSITPDTISLMVENKVRKTLAVDPRVRGEVAAGYEVIRVSLTPTEITVEGPLSEVNQTTTAVTDWIDLRRRSETFQEGVSVVPDNSRVRLIGARSAIATVEVAPIPFVPEPDEVPEGEAGEGEGEPTEADGHEDGS